MKKFTVHTEDLNQYGFWVKTSGIDTSGFDKNPICLWNHHRSWRGTSEELLPIGIWEELEVAKDGNMTATPKFDMDDEFAAKIANKVEKDFVRSASIGITILEWSEAPENLKPGQTRPTVVRSVLREISVCDIPANSNAVVFYSPEGEVLNLSDNAALAQLPVIQTTSTTEMNEVQILALSLGLPQTAQLAEIQTAVKDLQSAKAERDALQVQLKAIEDKAKNERNAEAKLLLDTAVSENRIDATQRSTFETLFASNHDAAKLALAAIPKPGSLASIPAGQTNNGKFTYQGKTFSQLSKESPDLLLTLKDNDYASFNELYKAEFGKDYKK